MQELTFELISDHNPIQDPDVIREYLNRLTYLRASVILKHDNSVAITANKNIYTLKSNLTLVMELNLVDSYGRINLDKENYGVQEVLVNMEEESEPGFGEIINFTVYGQIIQIDSNEYNNKSAYVRYLTTK